MIINIKNKKDLITIDLRTKQIRYLNDIENRGLIEFINLSSSDIEGYEYLYINSKKQGFLRTLKEDLKSFLNKDISLKDLRFVKGGL